jgi:predicted amidohydrolase YtcJ
MHISRHVIAANTAAMRTKGVTAAIKHPEGGAIVREPGSRKPEGLIQESALQVYFLDVLVRPEPVEVGARKRPPCPGDRE